MFKYDFIILYEHRKRELENAVLLAMMLEKKGYRVVIEYRWSARILFQRADVIMVPYLYQNETVIDFALHPFCFFKKIINLQYEQVFQKIDEKKLASLPNGIAKKALHISWGNNMTKRFQQIGIEVDRIFELGQISIDLNMPKYRENFLTKDSISKQFSIPLRKKWLLFVSSFSCAGLTKSEYERWKDRSGGMDYFAKISYKSQPIILDYLEKLAKDHPEIVVVYRPHPHEVTCCRLAELESKYDNFKVIADYTVRQWILVADYISTWCSTSLVDILFANKPCAIIRPILFQEEYDYPIYRDQKIISDYNGLEAFINSRKECYKINPTPIREYYSNSDKADAFEKLRDLCIKVRNSKKFEYDYYKASKVSTIYLIMLYIYKILLTFAQFVDYSKITPEKRRSDVQYAYREMKGYKKEIKFYRQRFSRILKNEEA